MAFTALTPITPVGPLTPTGGVTAGSLVAAFVACDASNGNSFPVSGHEVLELRNSGSSAYTVTISSAPDDEGRTGDITSYSIAAGADVAFSFLGSALGWQQSDGTVHFTANNALVLARVLYVKR